MKAICFLTFCTYYAAVVLDPSNQLIKALLLLVYDSMLY